ncbi:MAG: dienelactone hydrolase family protein [Rhodospirillaceae bacterium]|jgi:carboxymethylenebutenolidase|nr:dienelactone hydrolase family protein [Rhodospirillaceae bacterium]
MGQTIDFAIGDIQTTAYVAVPEGAGPHPGVVVTFHRDGIDDFTHWLVDDLARNGYGAIAPDHYHAMPPGKTVDDRKEFLDDAQMALDLKAAADWLGAQANIDGDRLALVGHCMGGRTTWVGLVSLPGVFKCGCPFYSGNAFGRIGTPPPPMERLAAIDCPVMGFFGNDDRNPPPEDVDRIDKMMAELGKEHEFFRYDDTGHAFMGADPEKFREHSARDAWTRAVKFIAGHTGGTAPDVGAVFPAHEVA